MNTHQKINKAEDNLLMISMFSIVMLFAGLTSAYIVSKGNLDTKWDVIKLSNMFYFSTICIISSSVFAQLALNSSKNDNYVQISRYLLVTIFLAFLFFMFQTLGWRSLVLDGKFLSGNNVSSSYIYVLTIIHFLHVIGGVLALILIYVKSLSRTYDKLNFQGLKLGVRFWHFLGFIWLYLFLFLIIFNKINFD
mgnify:CR=1 FL=1